MLAGLFAKKIKKEVQVAAARARVGVETPRGGATGGMGGMARQPSKLTRQASNYKGSTERQLQRKHTASKLQKQADKSHNIASKEVGGARPERWLQTPGDASVPPLLCTE